MYTITTFTTVEFDLKKSDVPQNEKPILDALFKFRQSLQTLKKDSLGAVTLADVNAKAAELGQIVRELKQAREENYGDFYDRNRCDDVLDTIWMQIFHIWDKLVELHASLYPTYVTLVALSRSAEALRRSGAWTAADVDSLQRRLAPIDEAVASTEGKFVANLARSDAQPSLGDRVPMGQAVLASLLNRIHRTVRFLAADGEDLDELLAPLKTELDGMLRQLSSFEQQGVEGYSAEKLAPISKRLHQIDSAKGPAGNFANSDAKTGHATIAGLLNECFDKVNALVANLDSVSSDSPLYQTYRALLAVHSDLVRISTNQALQGDLARLSLALESIQQRLEDLEKQRVDGIFVPSGHTFEAAVKLPGQATMHKLLHDCHSQITKIVDPVSLPVGEALVSTYELLVKQRAVLRKLRAWASAGWDVKKDVEQVEAELRKVETQRVRGLFVGPSQTGQLAAAQSAELVAGVDTRILEMGSDTDAVPDGQATISALMDECDSLVWQVRCMATE